MLEDPGIVAMMAVMAGVAAWTGGPGLPRASLWTGAAILVAAWAALLRGAWLGSGSGTAIGPGLLAWFGSDLGLILVALGLLLRLGRWLWRPEA